MPGRNPWSRSCRRTHSRSVSASQPIFAAIDWIAAHCDPCSPRCSNTIRTARSLTSGEYRVCFLLMAPSSQRVEPPRKPGRFTKAGFPPWLALLMLVPLVNLIVLYGVAFSRWTALHR